MKKVFFLVASFLVLFVGGWFAWSLFVSDSQASEHRSDRSHSLETDTSSTESTSTMSSSEQPIKKPTAMILPGADNQALDAVLTNEHFSGTALVVRRGKTLLHKAYGMANETKQIGNTTATKYYIGSAQKAIIATAILQLDEKKELSVDDPVSKYVPDFPNGQQIKLTNLLNHTSGLTGRTEGEGPIDPEQVIQEIKSAGINGTIGSWHYSDSNYAMLAYIVSKVSQQSIQSYVQENIFDPATMQNTGFYQNQSAVSDLAIGYKEKDGRLEEAHLPNLTQLYGAGDIYTTATDFYLFDQALMQGKLINNEEKKKMLTSGSTSTYGMGFYVNPGSYSSHGVLGGFNTINSFTHTGLTYILLLANTNQVKSLGQTSDRIYETLNEME